MPRGHKGSDVPRPAIADVLRELGADDVPTGFGWVRMRCPFHEDRTASAAVNHDAGAFNCHSCQRSGDGIKLLQTELGLTVRQAFDKARDLAGEQTAQPAQRKRRASDLLKRGD